MSAVPPFLSTPVGKPFRGWQDIDPSWLGGEVGSRYQYILRLMWDTLGELTRIGVNQRFPSLAQYSALEELGNDRLLPRGIAEIDESYRERLRRFRSTWRFAGNAPTLVKQLYDIRSASVSRIRYVCNGYNFGNGDIASNPATTANQFADWWTYDNTGLTYLRADPSNWNWDNNVTFLSNLNPQGYPIGLIRFWIIVYYDDFPTIPEWGGPEAWGDPGLFWGIGADPELRAYLTLLYSVVANFKSASSHMGSFPGYSGGLILADPAETGAPWGAGGPFDPTLPPGSPMPSGDWNTPINRTPNGVVYLTGT